MRRLLPIALATSVFVSVGAGVASARFANDGPAAPKAAPFHAPAALPREDASQPGSFGFRTAATIAAKLEGAPAPAPASAPRAATSGTSASITVTATVLPVVMIVVDETGDVIELVTNTPERNARDVLYLVRSGSASGAGAPLDAATWADARAALAAAHAGTGTIWTA